MKFFAFISTILFVYLGNITVTSNTIDKKSSSVIENISENDLYHSDEPVADEYEFPEENSQSTSKEDLNPPSTSNVKTYNQIKNVHQFF